jgi:hypothetical protein
VGAEMDRIAPGVQNVGCRARNREKERCVVAETNHAHDLWAEPVAAVGAVRESSHDSGASTAQRGMS